MFTSNYARLKRLPAELRPVAISIKPPYWCKCDREMRLAPTVEMLQMSPADYNLAFDAILATLDPTEIFTSLGDNAVLLCFESPNIACHRRRVAEWLENALGIIIPEYGFAREFSLPYHEMPWKLK